MLAFWTPTHRQPRRLIEELGANRVNRNELSALRHELIHHPDVIPAS